MFLRSALIVLICSAVPSWATSAYTTTSSNQFGTIDLSTGTFTLIGTTELASTPMDLSAGLGEVGGVLYGAESGTDALYEINQTTGALTDIGSTITGEYQDLGSTLTTMYAMDATANLYSVDPSTGALTLIGSTGLADPGTSSLSTNSGILYFAEYNSGYQLYTLNTTTGAATLVGATSTPIGALMWDGTSVLYGVEDPPDPVTVATLSTSNGAVTAGSAVAGTGGAINGLAPIPASTPEPASWGLLGAGFAILVGVKRRASNR